MRTLVAVFLALLSLAVHAPGAQAQNPSAGAATSGDQSRFYPPAYLKNRPADFLRRARDSLQLSIDRPAPPLTGSINPTRAILDYSIAALALNQDTARANDYIGQLSLTYKSGDPANPKEGAVTHLSLAHAIRLYMLYRRDSAYMPGRLTAAAQQHLEQEFERTLQAMIDERPKVPAYGAKYDAIPQTAESVWPPGSENIWMQRAQFKLLAWQVLKGLPATSGKLYDGHTPAEHYDKWKKFYSIYLDELAKKGLFIEVGAGYEHYTVDPLYNLFDFADDPVIKKKSEMLLDLWFASAGERAIKYVQGGGKSRAKANHRYRGESGEWGAFTVWFGNPDPATPYTTQRTFFEPTTSYTPSPVSTAIIADTPTWASRGSYTYTERRLGLTAGLRAGDGIDFVRTILHYGFVTPSYVIGGALLDPKVPTYMTSRMGRWLGVIFNGDPDGRIFPDVLQTITATGKENSLDSDNFYTVQDRNVMIAQKSWRFSSGYVANSTVTTRIYFSATLDDVQEEECWIFAREGTAYAAVKVVSEETSCGYTWLRPWVHADKADATNYNYVNLTDPEGMAPIIIVVDEAKDYGGNFDKFKAAIKAEPVQGTGGAVSFSTVTLSLAQPGPNGKYRYPAQIGARSGVPLNTSPARVYDSPFIRSDWNSGLIYIRKNNETEILDFRDPDKPVKTVGAAVSDAFPAGVGTSKPIVFDSQRTEIPRAPAAISPRLSGGDNRPLRRRGRLSKPPRAKRNRSHRARYSRERGRSGSAST